MKHTPGPWNVTAPFSDTCPTPSAIMAPDNCVQVAHAIVTEWCYDKRPINAAEACANARLIATAPDLLACLKWAYDALCVEWQEERSPETEAELELCRKAIAKAEA